MPQRDQLPAPCARGAAEGAHSASTDASMLAPHRFCKVELFCPGAGFRCPGFEHDDLRGRIEKRRCEREASSTTPDDADVGVKTPREQPRRRVVDHGATRP